MMCYCTSENLEIPGSLAPRNDNRNRDGKRHHRTATRHGQDGGKRKLSSKLWLERQLNDPYVAQAKTDGWRSRAAYS